jgi:prepilin-type N-terminal cleavage/methylation domain-containing protein
MLKPRTSAARSGFTLVELIVAMAILVIIVAALGQIMGTASNLTTSNNKHTDANNRARSVFDRMADDFARMVKRSDVDFIFFKATGAGGGANDTMFFYTEGASYYDGATPASSDYKNSVSLVGYRVNNGQGYNGTASPSNGQLERLGKALMWDSGTGTNPPMVFLNYPVPETGGASFPSTLAGAYATLGSSGGSVVGTPGNFNDSTDTSYHPLASNVFRFEYSFLLKDGTQSLIPVMAQATGTDANGVPLSNLTASAPPSSQDDNTGGYAAGSRWYDTTDKVGYICVDATAQNAVWHEIGIQDISAIVVTIAVLDDQGMVFAKNAGIDLTTKVAAQFPDLADGDADPATDIMTKWTAAITPANGGGPSTASVGSTLPQAMVSQIRIFQRFFYINNT